MIGLVWNFLQIFVKYVWFVHTYKTSQQSHFRPKIQLQTIYHTSSLVNTSDAANSVVAAQSCCFFILLTAQLDTLLQDCSLLRKVPDMNYAAVLSLMQILQQTINPGHSWISNNEPTRTRHLRYLSLRCYRLIVPELILES